MEMKENPRAYLLNLSLFGCYFSVCTISFCSDDVVYKTKDSVSQSNQDRSDRLYNRPVLKIECRAYILGQRSIMFWFFFSACYFYLSIFYKSGHFSTYSTLACLRGLLCGCLCPLFKVKLSPRWDKQLSKQSSPLFLKYKSNPGISL